jgi:alkylation response protein AidB-like acyl-CoA dehydrogenase
MAKASAGECQSLVFKHGVQLFGAMGFTWENDVQFALKNMAVEQCVRSERRQCAHDIVRTKIPVASDSHVGEAPFGHIHAHGSIGQLLGREVDGHGGITAIAVGEL